MIPNPHQLFDAVGSADLVTCNPIELLFFDLFPDRLFLLLASLICPDNRRPQGLSIPVHRNTAHHLTAERHTCHLFFIHICQQQAIVLTDSAPPVLRILFCPGAVEKIRRIGTGHAFDQLSIRCKQSRLVSGSAKIMRYQIFFHFLSPYP